MKTLKRMMAAAAVAVLAAQPVVASAPSQKLSLKNAVAANARVAGKAGDEKAEGGIPVIAIIAGVAVIVGIVVLVSDGNSDSP